METDEIEREKLQDDPLANDVAAHWKENEKDAMWVSKEWTMKFAK